MLNFIAGAIAIAVLGAVMAGLIYAAWVVWNLDGPW